MNNRFSAHTFPPAANTNSHFSGPCRAFITVIITSRSMAWTSRQTISEGKPSPRTEIVYNIEPFRAGIRQGDWKLIRRTPLPSAVELYNIRQDPSEKNNLAAENPEKVTALQKRVNELAAGMAKPMLLRTEFKALRERLSLPPALPNEELQFNEER